MKKSFISNPTWLRVLSLVLLVAGLLFLSYRAVEAQTITGCKEYENCTANDFGDLIVTDVVVNQQGCIDTNGDEIKEVNLSFTITYPSLQPERYDIGSILALDGEEPLRDPSLLPGICARDYLPPPLTTTLTVDGSWPNALGEFWDAEETGDLCGDLPPTNSATRRYENLWVACDDDDGDGQIDISICLYYDNNAKLDCFAVMDATEGTTAKCECQSVNIPVSPTAITLESLKAGSALPNTTLIAIGLGLGALMVASIVLTLVLRKRA